MPSYFDEFWSDLYERGGGRLQAAKEALGPGGGPDISVPGRVGTAALNVLGIIDAPFESAVKATGIGRGGMTVTPGGAELGVPPQEISEEQWASTSGALGSMLAIPGIAKGYRGITSPEALAAGRQALKSQAGAVRFAEDAPSLASRAAWRSLPKRIRREMQQDPTKFYGIAGHDPKYRGSYGKAHPEEIAEWTKKWPELKDMNPDDIRAIRVRETPGRKGTQLVQAGPMPQHEVEAFERFMTSFHEQGHAGTLLGGGAKTMPMGIRRIIDDVFFANPNWKQKLINRLREAEEASPGTFGDISTALYSEAAATLHGEQGVKAFKALSGRKSIPGEVQGVHKTGLYPTPPEQAVNQWGKKYRKWVKEDFQPKAARHKEIARELGVEPTPGGPVKKTVMTDAEKAKLIERVEQERIARGARRPSRDEATEWLRKHPDATDAEKKAYIDRKGVRRKEPYRGPKREEKGRTALDEILKKEGYDQPTLAPDDIDEALRADYPELFEEVTPKGVKKPLPAKEEAPITPVRREDIWSSKREPFEPLPTRKTVPPAVKVRLPKGGQPVKGKAPLRKKYTKEPRTVSPEAIRGYRMRGRRMAEKMNKDPKAVITTLVRERLKAQFTPEEIEVFVQKALKGI